MILARDTAAIGLSGCAGPAKSRILRLVRNLILAYSNIGPLASLVVGKFSPCVDGARSFPRLMSEVLPSPTRKMHHLLDLRLPHLKLNTVLILSDSLTR